MPINELRYIYTLSWTKEGDRPKSSISLDLAQGFLDSFRVVYPYLLECELPLQTADEYKRLDSAAPVMWRTPLASSRAKYTNENPPSPSILMMLSA